MIFLKDKLNLGTEREYTAEGFLKVPARISRAGIQEYRAGEMGVTDRNPDDIVKIFRPENEVFSNSSMTSFSSKPVTDNHPPELITSKNSKLYSVGMSDAAVVRDGDYVKTTLNIIDKDAITSIESGKVEISNGYTTDIDWTPGTTAEGVQYDGIQKNIKGNHIAIVSSGRAGSSCRLADNSLKKTGGTMIKIMIDEVDFEMSEQLAQAVAKLQSKLSDAKLKLSDAELKLKKDTDLFNAKLDDVNSKILTNDAIHQLVVSRAKLINDVKKVNPDVIIDNKNDIELIKEVVALKCPSVVIDSVSDDYVKARFDMLVETIDSKESNSQQQLDSSFTKMITSKKNEIVDNRSLDIIAREKMIESNKQAWKFGSQQ